MILLLASLGVLAWIARTLYALLTHYRQAQCMGVPILISPVGVSNIIWLLTQEVATPYIERLPFGLGSWTRYNQRSWIWQFSDRGKIHREYGPVIAHVTPSDIQVWVADKDVALEIIKGKDRAQFDKPREDIRGIDFLAPHLMTACGETWKRHRRVVATPFNQRNNRIFWREALNQGVLLGEHWSAQQEGVTTVWHDNETVAMNVMVTAGFGLPRERQKPLSKSNAHPESGDSLDFHSSISFVVTHFLWVVVLPSSFWFPKYLPPFPQSLRAFFTHVRAFKGHLREMIATSRALLHESENKSSGLHLKTDNLLTALVHHSEELKGESQGPNTVQSRNSLTDDEIYANLFGLAFAGHETTAHTLSYSIFLLAAHPDIQNWVAEEIKDVLGGRDLQDLDLDETFPLLNRTRAIMHETLRVFTPLANVLKRSLSSEVVTIQVRSGTLRIPPRAYVLPSTYALHASEEYWGYDSLEWNPKRWVSVVDSTTGQEEFSQPSPPGAFLPWSDGPRACPGSRFSQVEFVAVVTALLSRFRISAVCEPGEDQDSAIGRVKAAVYDSNSVITLQIKHPERIPIRLEPVGIDPGA